VKRLDGRDCPARPQAKLLSHIISTPEVRAAEISQTVPESTFNPQPMPEAHYRIRKLLQKLLSGNIARNTLKTTVVFGVRLAAQAATLIFLARLLGPALFGEFSAITALAILFGTLSTLGTHLVLLGETAIDPANRSRILPFAIPTTLVCGMLLLLGYLAVVFGFFPSEAIPLAAVLLIGITELIIQPLNYLATCELQGLSRTAESQLLLSLPLILRAIMLLGLLFVEKQHALEIFAVGYITSAILTWLYIQKRLPALWPSMRYWSLPSIKDIRNTLGYAVLMLTYSGTFELDKALSPRMIGASNAGTYSAGARIVAALALPVVAMSTAATPRIFKESANNTSSARLSYWMFAISLVYGAIAGAMLWICAPLFIFLFGKQYTQIPEVLSWLAFVCPAICMRLTASTILMGLKKPWLRCGLELSGIILFLLSAPFLSSQLNYTGFIFSLTLSEWGMASIGWLIVLKKQQH